MFCDGCGTTVHPGQSFCSGCGKQIVGLITPMPYVRGRVKEHLQLVGILWLGLSAFNLIGAVVLFVLANTLLAPGGPANAPAWLHLFLTAIAIILSAKSFLGFIGGWGLTALVTLAVASCSSSGNAASPWNNEQFAFTVGHLRWVQLSGAQGDSFHHRAWRSSGFCIVRCD